MTEQVITETIEYARKAIEVASDKFASDIVLLDIREVSFFADYFVIMSGESSRQLNNLEEEITKALRGIGIKLYHREGTPNSGWLLLDFGDFIVHIFGVEEREFYNIEGAWRTATEVVRLQ